MVCISRREMIRDRVAKAALRTAMLAGLTVQWKNPGQSPISLYAIPDGESSKSLRLTGGETSRLDFMLIIPRQGDLCNSPSGTPFPPPEGLLTGAVVFVHDTPYAVNVGFDAESVEWAPVFYVQCMRYDITVEIDGISNA